MEVAESRITPEDIGVDFVPRQCAQAVETPAGDDLVVAAVPFEPCHVLNPTAALVWRCFDGEADLATIIAELAEALSVDAEVIVPDIVELTRHLGREGLLEGVASAAEMVQVETPAAVRLEPGDRLDDFELSDLDGRPWAWDQYRGRKVLLVHWSPFCGYCLQIANALGELRPVLDEQGIEMVFVTVGDAEANRPVFDQADMGKVTVLGKREGVDPFAGLGTPAAYLIDEDGRLAVPLAYGAVEVPKLVDRLAGVEAAPGSPEGVRYLPGGGGVCGPKTGPVQKKATDWAGVAAYALGEFHVGIRYNSQATEATLDRLFAGTRVQDPQAQDNCSVALYPSGGGSARELNLLVRSGMQMVRSRSAARVLRALLGYLSFELYNPDRELLQASGLAVVRGDDAYVLPSILYNTLSGTQPRLARLGLRVVDRPWVSLDATTAELVVPEPVVPHDPAVLDELSLDMRLGSELPEVAPGRYGLRGWVLLADAGTEGPLSLGSAVARAMGLITWISSQQTVLDQLVALFGRVPAHAVRYEGAEHFIERLPEALG